MGRGGGRLRRAPSCGNGVAEELDRLCLDTVARYKRPRAYFVDILPKNNYGKVLKTTLRQQLNVTFPVPSDKNDTRPCSASVRLLLNQEDAGAVAIGLGNDEVSEWPCREPSVAALAHCAALRSRSAAAVLPLRRGRLGRRATGIELPALTEARAWCICYAVLVRGDFLLV